RRSQNIHEGHLAVLGDPELDDELGGLVLALSRPGVLHAGVAPLVLDHPADAIEVVVELRIARVEWDRLALDASPALTAAAGSAPASHGLEVEHGLTARGRHRRDLRAAGRRRARRL